MQLKKEFQLLSTSFSSLSANFSSLNEELKSRELTINTLISELEKSDSTIKVLMRKVRRRLWVPSAQSGSDFGPGSGSEPHAALHNCTMG